MSFDNLKEAKEMLNSEEKKLDIKDEDMTRKKRNKKETKNTKRRKENSIKVSEEKDS
jgi:hypothetical protein